MNQVVAEFLVSVYQDLGIRLVAEKMTPPAQALPERRMIVDLSVEHCPNLCVLIRHGLTPACHVDDA